MKCKYCKTKVPFEEWLLMWCGKCWHCYRKLKTIKHGETNHEAFCRRKDDSAEYWKKQEGVKNDI